jgi:hypothetical protein
MLMTISVYSWVMRRVRMDLKSDKRIVLTLDAGGTIFGFSAIRGGKHVTETVVSHGRNSRDCYTPKWEKGSL